jgi:hypothetical protein
VLAALVLSAADRGFCCHETQLGTPDLSENSCVARTVDPDLMYRCSRVFVADVACLTSVAGHACCRERLRHNLIESSPSCFVDFNKIVGGGLGELTPLLQLVWRRGLVGSIVGGDGLTWRWPISCHRHHRAAAVASRAVRALVGYAPFAGSIES